MLTGIGPQGTPLMAIGYRYSSKSTLLFIASQDARSTRLGSPYKMKYTDEFGNVCVQFVDQPGVLSEYFTSSNIIYYYNQVSSQVRLESRLTSGLL